MKRGQRNIDGIDIAQFIRIIIDLIQMHRQQQSPTAETEARQNHRHKREESLPIHRPSGQGIKVVSNLYDETRMYQEPRSKIQHISHKDRNGIEQISRVSSIKGIQVMSSRQSSNERPIATSRSHSRQKQSRQIKSQTNISEFQSNEGSKEPSIERRSPSVEHRSPYQSDMLDLGRIYQEKFREALLRQNAMHQLELDQLRDIIGQNEERINNLIDTLNILIQKGEKKQKVIEKLQERLKSIQAYGEQCYEYSLRRCEHIQTILRELTYKLDGNFLEGLKINNKVQYIETIMRDVFIIQRYRNSSQQRVFDNQINLYGKVLKELEDKFNELSLAKHRIESQKFKQNIYQEYTQQLKVHMQVVQQRKMIRSSHHEEGIEEDNYDWIERQEIQLKLACLESKINTLQRCKEDMQKDYLANEQKTKQVIWELSNLLNKHERQLQKRVQQNEELQRYNKQIENRLIQAKLRENNYKSQLQNSQKEYSSLKLIEQHEKILNQHQVYREKFENSFRHNQYLQQINGRNNLRLLESDKEISDLQIENKRLREQIDRIQKEKSIFHRQNAIIAKQKDDLIKQKQEILKHKDQLSGQHQWLRQSLQRHSQQIIQFREENELKRQEIDRLRQEIARLNKELQEKQLQIPTIKESTSRLQSQIISQKDELLQLKTVLAEKIKKEVEYQQTIDSFVQTSNNIKTDYNQIYTQFLNIKNELDEQLQYSAHLQDQNEKLSKQLQEYTSTFQTQSLNFKTTIDKLKQQNGDLLRSIQQNQPSAKKNQQEVQTYRAKVTSISNNSGYSRNYFNCNQPSIPLIKTVSIQRKNSTNAYKPSRLTHLQKALIAQGYKTPVRCQIDGTGYLKHYDNGTYIVDANENLFDLSAAEQQEATKLGLILLFQ